MEKRKKFVLSIGFTIILITCITIVVSFIHDIRIESADPLDKRLLVPVYFWLVFPVIPEELFLLISVYKLVNYNPRTFAKICYIISIVILLTALVFQFSVFTGVITDDIMPEGKTAASSRFIELLLLTEWPVVFVSSFLWNVKSGKIESDA